MEEIIIPPNPIALMESTRAIGYTLESAIADIVDNSIAADAGKVSIMSFPADDVITILDDGKGMDEKEINVAMQYGGKNPLDDRTENDLGRFGLGLKTASLSQCEKLTVIAKKGNDVVARQWDLDYIRETGKWALLKPELEKFSTLAGYSELMDQKSGTLVIWQRLGRLSQGNDLKEIMPSKISSVRKHLSLVFHRYISGEASGKRFDIKINGQDADRIDPFLSYRGTLVNEEQAIRCGKSMVYVSGYVLPNPRTLTSDDEEKLGFDVNGKADIYSFLQARQGYYIYRNKRLITWGTWFGSHREKNYQLARVKVDISSELDNLWVLDVKKSTATPSPVLLNRLIKVKNFTNENSRKVLNRRQGYNVRQKEEKISLWDRVEGVDYIRYIINREHPIIKTLLKSNPNNAKALSSMLTFIERELPIDSIFVDNNAKLEIRNDEYELEELKKGLEDIIGDCSLELKKKYFALYRLQEPFCNYPELFD